MALKGKGRIIVHKRGGCYIYISKDVAKDSAFPFTKNSDVSVKIEDKKIKIE